MSGAISVRQLNFYVRSLIEADRRLSDISVTGEISNFKNHYSSGHWYFTLKDSSAAVRCVMFRSAAARVREKVCDGMTVTLIGRVSLYEKDGQYQFYAEEMTVGSEGELARKFEETKRRLLAEGLFDGAHKRPLPPFPKRIAVITSPTGAAVRDILNITERRYPLCDIVLCPAAVQGEAAASEMIDALKRVYRLSGIDLIIIGRGGGSAEDLSAFNDEALARKIYESPVPVISAVGHETDFSISDLVSDLRAPTPSAAAELAVPDKDTLLENAAALLRTARRALKGLYERDKARYERAAGSPFFRRPAEQICDRRAERADRASERLGEFCKKSIDSRAALFSREVARLEALSPLKVMARGFAAVSSAGERISSAEQLKKGDILTLRLADGSADCTVEEIRKNG